MNAHDVLTIDAVQPDSATTDKLDRLQRRALIVGAVGTVLFLLSLIQGPGPFFQSYLLGYLFWAAIPIGCIPLIMLHYLISAEWGAVLMRFFEAGTRTLPLIALLFVPILLGMPYIYIWANQPVLHEHHMLAEVVAKKTLYLNAPFFAVRAAIYFATWIGLAFFLNRWSRKLDETGQNRYSMALWRFSGLGMVAFVLTVSFAAFDWVMSINPAWFSGIFGALIGESFALEAFAFMVIVTILLSRQWPVSRLTNPKIFRDFGTVMLAMIMVWAYFQVSQLIIIWSANLPEETPWYLTRTEGGWRILAIMLGTLHFGFPFLLLLNGGIRSNPRMLLFIASLILFMRFVDFYWMVIPPYSELFTEQPVWGRRLAVHWQDFAAVAAIGGIWIWAFIRQLKKKPLVAVKNPNLPKVHHHA